jgi:predicted DCC family thiol-disulfide oxidoreductase YuxK
VVLIAGGRARLRSDAAIEALRLLGGPWSIAAAARILPGPLRDAAYRTIARHRHAWFGRAGASGAGETGTRRE